VFSGRHEINVDENTFFTNPGDHSEQGHFPGNHCRGAVFHQVGEGRNPAYTLHAGASCAGRMRFIPVIKIDYNPFAVALTMMERIAAKNREPGRGGLELSISYIGFLDRDNSCG